MLKSNRNIELLTQTTEGKWFTAEDYCKWYDYFIVENGVVTTLDYGQTEEIEEIYMWNIRDHCLVLIGFLQIAKELNAKVDSKTFMAAVVAYFENNDCRLNCIKEENLGDNYLLSQVGLEPIDYKELHKLLPILD